MMIEAVLIICERCRGKGAYGGKCPSCYGRGYSVVPRFVLEEWQAGAHEEMRQRALNARAMGLMPFADDELDSKAREWEQQWLREWWEARA